MTPPKRLAVSIIRPPSYQHSPTFDELYEILVVGLERLGIEVERLENSVLSDIPTILLGAHLLDDNTLRSLPEKTIIYNLEQVDVASPWMGTAYREALQSHEVWDYNEVNAQRLFAEKLATRIVWAPIGYVDGLHRIEEAPDQDIDVLFYGSINGRRRHILDGLKAVGLNVVEGFGVYGEERDALIARARVVLNMHFYESGIFEWVRVLYLLANRKFVVSEDSVLTAFDGGIKNVVTFSPYNELVETCQRIIASPPRRDSLDLAIEAYLEPRREERILSSVLDESMIIREFRVPEPIPVRNYTYPPDSPAPSMNNEAKATKQLDDHLINFICCVNDWEQFARCQAFLQDLKIPDGYHAEILTVEGAPSMAAGYNLAMRTSRARYKVYLHQDVYITHTPFLHDIVKLFSTHEKLGLLGVIGAKTVPENGIWWESPDGVGQVVEIRQGERLLKFRDADEPYQSVGGLDGVLLVTQYDLPWRQDLFSSWHFYNLSQCFEFMRSGYEVGIPPQEKPWCTHDCGPLSNLEGFEAARQTFCREYLRDADARGDETGETGIYSGKSNNYFGRSNPFLLAQIRGTPSAVLDIGCGEGLLGEDIKRAFKCRVEGIEYVAQAAQKARSRLDRVMAGNIEEMDLSSFLDEKCFDYIIFGDVLEHLIDPWKILHRVRPYLKDDGVILTSIPNVGHISILLNLLGGRWPYEDAGLLDKTHLRFFTAKEIPSLFQSSGYRVTSMATVVAGPYTDAIAALDRARNELGIKNDTFRQEAQAYQYIVTAVKA